MDGAVNVNPDSFEGTNQDGSCPGPYFITMSVIKDKTKICEQLISSLSKTITILTKNLPNACIHCIKKSARLPPLSSASCSYFPTTGMQVNNYMYIQNSWPLTPGVCEIIYDLVHYLVPWLHTIYWYWYQATVLLYLRRCALLVLKPQQKGFPDLLGI